jgi:hypothetical protein
MGNFLLSFKLAQTEERIKTNEEKTKEMVATTVQEQLAIARRENEDQFTQLDAKLE